MPLIHSASKAALKQNMRTLHEDIGRSPHVKSRAQAEAIAFETQRRAAQGRDMGGGVADPGMPMAPAAYPMAGATPVMNAPLMADGGVANRDMGGGFNVMKHPHLGGLGYDTHNAARQLHTGPVLSAVPGRTDHHPVKVPSGSYVVPADIVSGRGQGNTIAGTQLLQQRFKMGPYGSSVPKLGHGSLPKPPAAPKPLKFAEGGLAEPSEDEDASIGVPTPVNIAGGELVIPPENLMETVHPDLKEAHRIMDEWVLHERKKLRKTLAKLPGPARD